MPDQVSDHFSGSTQPVALSAIDGQFKVSAGIGHARMRKKVARITLDLLPVFTTNDVARIMQFKSGDRLFELTLVSAGASTVVTVGIGLHESGNNHDGVVIDLDLFASALAVNGTVARSADMFTESSTLDDFDRGLTLWELAAIGAASYTEDPFLDFDLTLTAGAAVTTADEPLIIEAWYTSGD